MFLAFIGMAEDHPNVKASARDLRIIQQLRSCIQNMRRQHLPSDLVSSIPRCSSLPLAPAQLPEETPHSPRARKSRLGSLLTKARSSLVGSSPREMNSCDRLFEAPPMLIAEQLCLIEQELLMPVQWGDLVAWPSDKAIPSIHGVVEHFNASCQYFTRELERWAGDRARQAQIVSHLIRVASACLDLHNYSAMLQVVLGIQTANVRHFPPTLAKTWDTLEAFASPLKNWGHMRSVMDEHLNTPLPLKEPAIPFLGVYLSDITYTFELPTFISSTLQDEQIIKFDKFRTLAKIIRRIQDFQAAANYPFKRIPDIYHRCRSLDAPYM